MGLLHHVSQQLTGRQWRHHHFEAEEQQQDQGTVGESHGPVVVGSCGSCGSCGFVGQQVLVVLVLLKEIRVLAPCPTLV